MNENEWLDDGMVKGEEPQLIYERASMNQRFANFILDRIGLIFFVSMVYSFCSVLEIAFMMNLFSSSQGNYLMDYLLTAFLGTAYYTLFEYNYGKSPGKFVTRTHVQTEFGEQPDLNIILGRSLARFIPFEPFSFLGGNARGWHDSLTQTIVVKDLIHIPSDGETL